MRFLWVRTRLIRAATAWMIGCIGVGALLGPNLASAQQISPTVQSARPLGDIRNLNRQDEKFSTSAERFDSAWQKPPVHFGGFLLFPELEVQQKYTDNVYAAPDNEKGDWVTQATPSLYVIKPFGRHQFDFSIEGDVRRHWQEQSEDLENVRLRMGAAFEAKHDLHFPIELYYERGHEERDQNLGAAQTRKPIAFANMGGALGIAYKPGRFGLNLIGRYADLSFDNGTAIDGAPVIRSAADRTRYSGEAQLSYDLSPNHKPFVQVSIGKSEYPNNAARDSTDMGVMVGWEFAYKGLVRARLAGGVTHRDYDDNAVEDIKGFSAAADINWNIARRATLNLSYKRSLLEDNDVMAGALNDTVHAGLDYELARRILLTTYVAQSWLDFENSARHDEILGAGFSLRYVFNPTHSVSAGYDYARRESTSPGIEHGQGTYMLRYNVAF